MNFKIGDKVRITGMAKKYPWFDAMNETIGRTGTILVKLDRFYWVKIDSMSMCIYHYAPEDLELIQEEKKTYTKKQVVKEIPSSDVEITYDFLRENRACDSAISWFVWNFGYKAKYDDVLTLAGKERNDSIWLVEHRKYLSEVHNPGEYVLLKDVDENKFYAFKRGYEISFLLKLGMSYNIICINSSIDYNLKFADSNSHSSVIDYLLNDNKVYEFPTFHDFWAWVGEVSK